MGKSQNFAALGGEECDIPTTLQVTSGKGSQLLA